MLEMFWENSNSMDLLKIDGQFPFDEDERRKSRYAMGVPLKNKDILPVVKAWRKIVAEMGVPRNLNTDEESAVMSKEFQDMLKEQGIKHWA